MSSVPNGIGFDIVAKIDQLKASMASIRDEARRTKQAVESQPIRVPIEPAVSTQKFQADLAVMKQRLKNAADDLAFSRYIARPSGPIGGASGGTYLGQPSSFVPAGSGMMMGASASQVRSEAMGLNLDADERRRFASSAGVVARNRGLLEQLERRQTSFLETTIRAGAAFSAIQGVILGASSQGNFSASRSAEFFGDFRRSTNQRITGNEKLESIPVVGAIASRVAEAISGTSNEKVRQRLASADAVAERGSDMFRERTLARRAVGFATERAGAESITDTVARSRALAGIDLREQLAGIDQQVSDRKIGAEDAAALKTAVRKQAERVLISISDAAFEASAELFGEAKSLEAAATGDTRGAARIKLLNRQAANLRAAERNGGDVGGVRAVNAAELAQLDRQQAAEVAENKIRAESRVEQAQISAATAVLRAKGRTLEAERQEFERTSALKIKVAEAEAERLKNIDADAAAAAGNEARALKIEAEGQRAAFAAASQERARNINNNTKIIDIGSTRGANSARIEGIRQQMEEAVRNAGSPEEAAAIRGNSAAQLRAIGRDLDRASEGQQAAVFGNGSFRSLSGGSNDPNRETVTTLKGEIANLLREIATNTKETTATAA